MSLTAQWVVASSPSSSPAAASTSEPVHTEVVQVEVSWTPRSQSSISLVVEQRPGAKSARNTRIVGRRDVGRAAVGLDRQHSVVGALDAGFGATKVTVAPGSLDRTS